MSYQNTTGPVGPDAGVKRWLETTARDLQHVSVITLAEIEKGIELLSPGKRRMQLEQWFKQELVRGVVFRPYSGRRSRGSESLGVTRGPKSSGRKTASDH
jgi:hypothetical protein